MAPSRQFVLQHTQNVELNDIRMTAAAAPIPRRRLRSSRIRNYVPPVPRRHAIHPPPPSPPPPPPPSPTPSISSYGGLSPVSGGGFGDDDDDDRLHQGSPISPVILPRRASSAPITNTLSLNILLGAAAAGANPAPIPVPSGQSQGDFARSQIADQPRLPWAWTPQGRAVGPYHQQQVGKWWSRTTEQLRGMGEAKRSDFGHIGRIMETELGEQLLGGDRCAACQAGGVECWVYSKGGAQQVSRPGSTCARCRVAARPGGCSLSKRKPQRKRSPPPPSRDIHPNGPFSGPPPGGAGGCGIAV